PPEERDVTAVAAARFVEFGIDAVQDDLFDGDLRNELDLPARDPDVGRVWEVAIKVDEALIAAMVNRVDGANRRRERRERERRRLVGMHDVERAGRGRDRLPRVRGVTKLRRV